MMQDRPVMKEDSSSNQSRQAMQISQKNKRDILFRRRRLTIMFVAAFIVFTFMGTNLYQSSRQLLVLKETHQQVEAEYKEVKKQEEALDTEVLLLNDDEYAAKVARSKYFYSKEGEQVYSIPNLSGNK